jgi:tetratricopeptide (TPR) repeat protein
MRLISLIPLAMILNVLAAQTPRPPAAALTGIVLLNELGGAPVDDVELIARGANRTKTTQGRFELDFPGKVAGQAVDITVSKKGYVVINFPDLHALLPRFADTNQFTILVCKESEREKWAEVYYRFVVTSANNGTRPSKITMPKSDLEGKKPGAELVQQTREQELNSINMLATELSDIRPDEVSPTYQKALSLFTSGRTTEAIEFLDEASLRSLWDSTKGLETNTKARDETLKVYLLKGQLLATQHRFDEALLIFKDVVKMAPTYVPGYFELGAFYRSIGKPQTASEVLFAGLGEHLRYKANILIELASSEGEIEKKELFPGSYEHDIMIRHLNDALNIFGRLDAKYPGKYSYAQGRIHLSIGIAEDNPDEINVARGIFTTLSKLDDSYQRDIADSLVSLADLHNLQGEQPRGNSQILRSSEKAYKQALIIYSTRHSQPNETESLSVDEAHAWMELGIVYWNLGQPVDELKSYKKAQSIYILLANVNPGAYSRLLADTCRRMALASRELKDVPGEETALSNEIDALRSIPEPIESAYDAVNLDDAVRTLESLKSHSKN